MWASVNSKSKRKVKQIEEIIKKMACILIYCKQGCC